MKFTVYNRKKDQEKYEALIARVEASEQSVEKHDKEILKNVMTTVVPIATAVQKLNREVGIQ